MTAQVRGSGERLVTSITSVRSLLGVDANVPRQVSGLSKRGRAAWGGALAWSLSCVSANVANQAILFGEALVTILLGTNEGVFGWGGVW